MAADLRSRSWRAATVVNQDGAGRARHRRQRRPHRRDRRSRAAPRRRAHRLPRPAYPAGRHRQPGAFPRARPRRTRKISKPARARAVLGGVTAVFEMPNTNPLTTTRGGARRQVRARHRPHALRLRLLGRRHARQCRRHSASSSACRAPPASRCSWAPRPARCWSPTMRACARSCKRPAAAPPSTARTSRGSRSASPCASPAIRLASGLARRDRGAALHRAAGAARARSAARNPCAAYLDRARRSPSSRGTRMSRACEATPHHLTLSADDYARLGTKLQMNPPVRGPEHRDGIWRGVAQGRRRRARLRPRAAHAGGEGQALSRQPVRHDRRADAGPDHARPRQGRPPDASSASSI